MAIFTSSNSIATFVVNISNLLVQANAGIVTKLSKTFVGILTIRQNLGFFSYLLHKKLRGSIKKKKRRVKCTPNWALLKMSIT